MDEFFDLGSKNPDIPHVTNDLSDDTFTGFNSLLMEFETDDSSYANTKEVLARQYKEVIAGIKKKVNISEVDDEIIYVLTIDAATPGRIAVLYYRNFQVNDYLEKILKWHTSEAGVECIKKMISGLNIMARPLFIQLLMQLMDHTRMIKS